MCTIVPHVLLWHPSPTAPASPLLHGRSTAIYSRGKMRLTINNNADVLVIHCLNSIFIQLVIIKPFLPIEVIYPAKTACNIEPTDYCQAEKRPTEHRMIVE